MARGPSRNAGRLTRKGDVLGEEQAEVRVAFTDLAKDAAFVCVQFSRNGTADLIATCYDQR